MDNNQINQPDLSIPKKNDSIPTQVDKMSKNSLFSNADFDTLDANLNIKIIGIGGAGGNIVNCLCEQIKDIKDLAKVYAFNTDAWALKRLTNIDNRFIIDKDNLKGYGSSGKPQIAKQGIINDKEIIKEELKGTDVLFLITGFGKGTGSGATPEIAKIANELGILTIALIGMPSVTCEGKDVYNNAYAAFEEIKQLSVSLSTICNERIFANKPSISFKELYNKANNEFVKSINGIVKMIAKASEINIDFSDIFKFFNANKYFTINHLDINRINIDTYSFTQMIDSTINNNISDINTNNAKQIVANFDLSENINNNLVQSFKLCCNKVLKTSSLDITLGIDVNKSNVSKLMFLISGNNSLTDINKEIKEVLNETKTIVKDEEINDVDEYTDLMNEIDIALTPTKDLQHAIERKTQRIIAKTKQAKQDDNEKNHFDSDNDIG